MPETHSDAPTLVDTIALLTQTPATLTVLLQALPPRWTESNEGSSTWTPKEVVAHMLLNEHTNWLPRARLIRESHEIRPFPPLTPRPGQAEDQTKSLSELLKAFAEIRSRNLQELTSWQLTPSDLQRQAIHPAFGPVTLSQLLATWSTHDLTHLHQITRTLAHQQSHAVGPWVQYLGVLHCKPRSE